MQISNQGLTNHIAEVAAFAAQRGEVGNTTKEAAAAGQFEELLATQLVTAMRKSLPEGFFGKGPGADIYEGWLDQHLGGALAKDGALGIAGVLKASWQAPTVQGSKS